MQMQGTHLSLFYYSAENSRIELDYVIQIGTEAYPVEVKAEENVHAKSMKTFLSKNTTLNGILLSMKPHSYSDRLERIPLYAFREEFIRRDQSQE